MDKVEMEYYLIAELLREKNQKSAIPFDETEREKMLRGLLNVRSPMPVAEQFLKVQNEYLQLRHFEKGIADIAGITPIKKDIYLWQGDITTLRCDAIVNAANNQMLGCFVPGHACIDNAIHTFAGIQLRLECAEIMNKQRHDELPPRRGLPTGTAKITKAYNLPSKYVIHTVGPIVQDELTEKQCKQLASCYRSCLEIAQKRNLQSVAFCCISTGEFHFPNQEAAEIAVSVISDFLKTYSINVIFNVFKDTDKNIYYELLK